LKDKHNATVTLTLLRRYHSNDRLGLLLLLLKLGLLKGHHKPKGFALYLNDEDKAYEYYTQTLKHY